MPPVPSLTNASPPSPIPGGDLRRRVIISRSGGDKDTNSPVPTDSDGVSESSPEKPIIKKTVKEPAGDSKVVPADPVPDSVPEEKPKKPRAVKRITTLSVDVDCNKTEEKSEEKLEKLKNLTKIKGEVGSLHFEPKLNLSRFCVGCYYLS